MRPKSQEPYQRMLHAVTTIAETRLGRSLGDAERLRLNGAGSMMMLEVIDRNIEMAPNAARIEQVLREIPLPPDDPDEPG